MSFLEKMGIVFMRALCMYSTIVQEDDVEARETSIYVCDWGDDYLLFVRLFVC